MATCGTPNANPTMFVTLSWIDADVTKNWLDCSWTNGETKEVYSTSISFGLTNTGYSSARWERDFVPGGGLISMFAYQTSSTTQEIRLKLETVQGVDLTDRFVRESTTDYRSYSDLGLLSVGDIPPQGSTNAQLISKQKNNTYTDVNGVTYTWVEGNNW